MSRKTERKQDVKCALTPKLRFLEYRGMDTWKAIPLAKLAERCKRKNSSEELTLVLTNSAEFGVVEQRDYFDKDIAIQGNLAGYYVVEKGDFVYNPRISKTAPVGPISRNNIGIGVMSPLYTIFRFNGTSDDFYAHYFQTTGWHAYLRKVSSTGARHDRMAIGSDDFIAMPLPVSSPAEQQKIADCLTSLDEVISIQSQKLDALKTHRKGLLEQLFPCQGETLPCLRFPEFQDAPEWEVFKLAQVATYRRGSFPQPYGLPEWYDEVSGMPFVQVFDVSDDLRLKPETKNKISKLASPKSVFIPRGTVIVTLQGSIGRVAITQYDAFVDRTLLLFESFIKPIDKTFFAYTVQLLFEIEKEKAPGKVIKTITKEALSNFVVRIPNITEQERIASCLSSLDDLIRAQSDKLESLKTHKKGLMQQLFPCPEEVEE